MPSYEGAAVERPVTVHADQPPRKLARRKATPPPAPAAPETGNKPLAERPTSASTEPPVGPSCPTCSTLMRTKLDGVWLCQWCRRPPAPATKPTTEDVPVNETTQIPRSSSGASGLTPSEAGRQLQAMKPRGGGRPPNPRCVCGSKMITAQGGRDWLCPSCGNGISKVDAALNFKEGEPIHCRIDDAAGRRGTQPSSVLGAGLSSSEAERIRQDLAAAQPKCTDVPHIDTSGPAAPGLNGDHETRAEESAKIAPSRPANNSRGEPPEDDGIFVRVSTPLPAILQTGTRPTLFGRIRAELLKLGNPPDRLEFPVDQISPEKRNHLRSSIGHKLGYGKFTTFTTADRKHWCIMRVRPVKEGEASR